MYRVYDTEAAIRCVQKYLSVVMYPKLKLTYTGVYDDYMRRAIIDFQMDNNIPPTGIVDYKTFDAIFEQYRIKEKINKVTSGRGLAISFPLYPGCQTTTMVQINKMISLMLEYYGHSYCIRWNGIYSEQTSKAVEVLRKIYLLPADDSIDELFYMRLLYDYDSVYTSENFA